MKIMFAWTGVTSYMADCWRALRRVDGIELKIIVEEADSGRDFNISKTFEGLDVEIIHPNGDGRIGLISDGEWLPDIIFAGGWRSSTTRCIISAFPETPKIFCLDMPWRWQFRCVAARFMLWRFLRRFDAAFVPGKMSYRYARWLGFPRSRIFRRLYAVDLSMLRRMANKVGRTGRRGFLYVGRYSPEKRIDLVERAHARYTELGGIWGLDCYGQGGKFAQPSEMPRIYAEHACLLLASSFDPWPLVMLEAKAAGLDVIASDHCGNCDELGAVKVPYGNVEAMAQAMLRMERNSGKGRIPVKLAANYSCQAWVRQVLSICSEFCRGKFFCPGMNDTANGMAVVARRLACDNWLTREYVIHGAWLPTGWIRCLCALLLGREFIRMPHGSYSPVYLEGYHYWMKRIATPIERFFLRHAKKVIATCTAEKGWIEAYEPRAKVVMVDLRKFDWGPPSGELGATDTESDTRGALRILYIGRLHPLKGVQYLKKAVEELNAQKKDSISFRIVSNAQGAEKEEAFAWCDALCMPTLSENFGIVIAEALARSKTVITTDGAPAWKDEPRIWQNGMIRLVYIEGYRDASPDNRVNMLKQAIKELSVVVRNIRSSAHPPRRGTAEGPVSRAAPSAERRRHA